jgi:hypothetical protein
MLLPAALAGCTSVEPAPGSVASLDALVVRTGPAACEFGAPLQQVSNGLAVWDERTQENRPGPPIAVRGLAEPVVPTLEHLPDGYIRVRANVPGRWRGLAVTGVETLFMPETDDIAHYITFAEPASRVLSVMNTNGFALDPATGRGDIDVRTEYGPGNVTLFVQARGGESALGCAQNE